MKRWIIACALALASAPALTASPLLDLMERNTVEIRFADDSALLTDAQMGALNALIEGRHEGASSSKVAVAAWSDKGFPGTGETLPKRDVDLARDRAEAVVRHVRTLSPYYRDIEVVNMAKRENVVARFLATKASKVKQAFDGATPRVPWAEDEAAIFKSHGAPGKAVVIVYDEAETLAH